MRSTSFFYRSILLFTCNILVLGADVGSTNSTAQEVTAAKPEAAELAKRVFGHVILTRARLELVSLSLPPMQETVVYRTASGDAEFYPTIHAISGPDGKGRVAYIEDYFFVRNEKDRKHVLKRINIDGKGETTILSRPGSATWATSRAGHGEIGTHLALAPKGGMVAFVSGLSEKQMPKALLYEGNIELWDIENKRKCELTTKAINQPLSWFPDGKRLAFARLVARAELPKKASGLEAFGECFGESWDQVPSIYILDIDTGTCTFIHVGWTPVVSSDGNTMLVGGWDSHSTFTWRRMQLKSGLSSAVHWPGDSGGAIAIPTENMVLYKDIGAVNAPLTNGDKNQPMLALKLAMFDSDNAQTVVSKFDPRDLVSFGRGPDNK